MFKVIINFSETALITDSADEAMSKVDELKNKVHCVTLSQLHGKYVYYPVILYRDGDVARIFRELE